MLRGGAGMPVTTLLKSFVPRRLYPSSLLRASVVRATGRRVHTGPFAGMQFVERATWGAYIPKLLGTYELELHGYVERLIAKRPSHIIDIGGAEGYYAVGLLRRLPRARLVVFEQQADARQELARLAQMNAVEERLSIRESCDPAGLAAALREGIAPFIVSDVEGYEAELLDPERIPGLREADLLIEVHDSRVAGCANLLCERFAPTHTVTRIPQQARTLADYPLKHAMARHWPAAVLKYGLNEFRSPLNSWVYLERTRSS